MSANVNIGDHHEQLNDCGLVVVKIHFAISIFHFNSKTPPKMSLNAELKNKNNQTNKQTEKHLPNVQRFPPWHPKTLKSD